MGRFMQILGILLLLALIYAVMAGLGLTKNFRKHKVTVKSLVLTDFEYPDDDYEWTTGGYVKMEPSTENKTHGKYCAKLTFLPANQFLPGPTPGVAGMAPTTVPTPGATPEAPAPTATWQPEIVMDVNSITQLKEYEWAEYSDLKLDAFNDQSEPVSYHVQVGDSHAYLYESSGPLTPKKVTNISIPLEDLTKNRVDLGNIRSLRFWVDMVGATQPVVVYLDYIRLEGDSTVPRPKPATTPTPGR